MKIASFLFFSTFLVNCSTPVPAVKREIRSAGETTEQAQPSAQSEVQVENKKPLKTENSDASANTDASASTVAADLEIMNLDEAKAKCAACHQPGGGDGANAWNTAGGSEEDWKSFAMAARAEVEANRMPPPSGLTEPDKKRMIAYLNKLLGMTPTATASPRTPSVVTFDYDSAKKLCVTCHSNGQNSPQLTKTQHWRDEDNKSKILKAVGNGSMPRGMSLSAAEREALLKFIESF